MILIKLLNDIAKVKIGLIFLRK